MPSSPGTVPWRESQFTGRYADERKTVELLHVPFRADKERRITLPVFAYFRALEFNFYTVEGMLEELNKARALVGRMRKRITKSMRRGTEGPKKLMG